jgi:MbtH protein
MNTSRPEDDAVAFKVVINDEEQYSIWPVNKATPDGWHDVGVSGRKADCLAHIDSVWVDMRPRSLREAMKHHQQSAAGADSTDAS